MAQAAPVAVTPALPARYYRDNFLRLCQTVEAQYADLLRSEEQQWLRDYYSLPVPAQCLYIRLVSRVGPWFRSSRLDYPEIGSVAAPLAELLARGFLQAPKGLSVGDLGQLYTRAGLHRRFAGVPGLPATSKAADLEAIAAWAEVSGQGPGDLLARALAASREQLVAPQGREHVALLQLLFFGNRRQGLTDFVLSDLGVANYYPYRLDRAHRLFPSRAAVDDYLACGEMTDHFYALCEAQDEAGLLDLAEALLAVPMAYPASERRWWRLCNRLARRLERLQYWQQALDLYRRSRLHPARERAARVLEALADWPAAIAQCRSILAAPWGEEEQEAAQRMLPRLLRRNGERPPPRPRDQFSQISLALDPGPGGVERAAARALAPDWAAVHYVENSLVNSLFGLAFWEQIFSPVAGAFHNPFQSAPADMYDGRFYPRRREALEARLAELARGDLAPHLVGAYHRFAGLQCRWVNWQLLTPELVAHSLAVIPAEHLLAMWRRMLFDPGERRRGFPDLLALGNAPGDYCMIEVKAPGDALQHSQKRWLRFFAEAAIPAAVAWVEWRHE